MEVILKNIGHLSPSGSARSRSKKKWWRGSVSKLVVSVQAAREHGTTLAQEHGVVDPQGKGKARRREGNWCRNQLHRLATVTKSPTSTVATSQSGPGAGDEARVEFAEAHGGEESA